MKQIKISTDIIKLSQFIKFSGFCQSGAEAKNLILNGRVKLNGELCSIKGKQLSKGDKVEIDEEILEVV